MSLWLGQSGRRCALAGPFIWSLSQHQTTITLNRTARATLFVVCLVVAQSSSAAAAFIACPSMRPPRQKLRLARPLIGLPTLREKFLDLPRLFVSDKVFYVSNRDPALSCEYGRNVMHAVMRDYSGSGAKKFFDLLESKKAEVKDVMMPIRGFVSYSLVRTARGGFSVTICQDKAGTDESVRVAREWIAKNARDTRVARPNISAGAVILHL
jgi:hypothetical protein